MIDYDFPGFCAKCHEEIAEFNGSDINGNLVITRFKGNATSATFVLDDKSKMQVALCLRCKDSLQPEDAPIIMDSVIRGWKHEIKFLGWEEPKKVDYIDKYSKLEITDRHDLAWNPEEKVRLVEAIELTKVSIDKEIIKEVNP